MSQKSSDVVIFGDNGKEILDRRSDIPSSGKKSKMGTGTNDITELIEVPVVKNGQLRFEWHEMLSRRTTAIACLLIFLFFVLIAVISNYNKKDDLKKYMEARDDRIARGCDEVTPYLSPDKAEDKDKGCRPQSPVSK